MPNLAYYTATRRVITNANPAANAEFAAFTVPAGRVWEPLALTVSLAQGATQTPLPILRIDDGTTVFADIPGASVVQAASTTTQYTWARGGVLTGQIGAGTTVRANAPLPELLLSAAARIFSLTVGLGANSDYAAPTLYVVEYEPR